MALGTLAALILANSGGCTDIPPEIPECEDGGSGGACEPPPAPPPPDPRCADPVFTSPVESATRYDCAGQAGGALVYNSAIIAGNGGAGVVQTDPVVTAFPGDVAVTACCEPFPAGDEGGTPPDGGETPIPPEIIACQRDCGRGACNRILDSLRNAAAEDDPSDGDCNALPTNNLRDDCQGRVRGSLNAWIAHIENNYDACVEAALSSTDPTLPFDDPAVAFDDGIKLELPDSNCQHESAGCLFGAELRPFCAVEDEAEATDEACEAAANPVDAPPGDPNEGVDESGGGVAPPEPPFGAVQGLVLCDGDRCAVQPELRANVVDDFFTFSAEGTKATYRTFEGFAGYELTIPAATRSAVLFDAFGISSGWVLAEVDGSPLTPDRVTWKLLDDVLEQEHWTITLKKQTCVNGANCETATRKLEVSVSAEPPKDGADDGGPGSPAGGCGGCACSVERSGGPRGMLLMLLALGLMRRRSCSRVVR